MTLKILLADDNQTFLSAVRRFLSMLPGAEVVAEARDGRAALAAAEKLQPDLLLLDISMPGMNGLEVARSMMSWPRAPKIVFLTMHDNAPYRAAAAALGVVGLVGKSDFVLELVPIVDRLLAERRDQG